MSGQPNSPLVHKKPIPYYVKRNDGELISRSDLQHDLLRHIFSDEHKVFTDPHPTLHGDPAGTKVTFRDLYVNTLIRSPRASKVVREKMLEMPEFATDFAMLALLANVGRINTTMAFFPEMKTLIRTYHPIPALQKTNGNLQDAPRIKNILKSCLLDGEAKAGVPPTPVDVLSRSRSGKIPPTSVVNLVFVMANHAAPLAQMHFDGTLDFLDLFLPIKISSVSRARAFLWLCFHYLESSDGSTNLRNPFADPQAQHPHKIPPLVILTQEEMERENIDSEEELQWAEKMALHRKEFQAKLDKAKDGMGDDGEGGSINGEDAETKGKAVRKSGARDPAAAKAVAKEKKAAADKIRREKQKKLKKVREAAALAINESEADGLAVTGFHKSQLHERNDSSDPSQRHRSPSPPTRQTGRLCTPSPSPSFRYSPYKPMSTRSAMPSSLASGLHSHNHKPHRPLKERAPSPPRSMLQHAWYVVTNTDPLLDSDEELADEHVRVDYLRRLHIICRSRGVAPPPLELTPSSAHGYNVLT